MATKTKGPTATMDPFIIITAPSGIKPTGESRRLIRRHVMKGKNTKASRNPMQVILPTADWMPKSPEPDAEQQKDRAAAKTHPRRTSLVQRSPMNATVTTMDLATMGFPTQLEPYMVELISRFYTIVDETGSPLARCTEKGTSDNPYDLIYNDLAHLHTVLYMAQSYFDARRQTARNTKTLPLFSHAHPKNPVPSYQHCERDNKRQEPSPLALKHMNKAIHQLRLKLEHPSNATSLSAIFVVLVLGTCAESIGDLDAAERHMLGLSQIIESRGGIRSLDGYALVRLKCCRFDISLSLKTCHPPLLVTHPSWKSHLATDSTHKYPSIGNNNNKHSTPLHRVCPIPDARLVNIWTDLLAITHSFNLDMQLGRPPDGVLVTEVLVGVMYRLLALDYSNPPSPPSRSSSPACDGTFPLTPDSIDSHIPGKGVNDEGEVNKKNGWLRAHELIRLAMMAFASTIFFDGHGLESDYPALARQLRHALHEGLVVSSQSDGGAQDVELARYHIWLLFTARVSVLGTAQDSAWSCEQQIQLRKVLGPQASSWARMKFVLKQFLWVDVMNDWLGKEFYDDATAMLAGKVRVGQGVFGV